jgi:hypothetical protein
MTYLLAASAIAFGCTVWASSKVAEALERRRQKLKIVYDRAIPQCRADVAFADGSHSMCFRLCIENETTSKLKDCEAWLESTDRFPSIGPVRLFWAGSFGPELSVDLIKGLRVFLQVCRITDANRVIMATPGEQWPVDSLVSQPGPYTFKIAVKGDDQAETTFYGVQLTWTGVWTTSEMRAVSVA